MGPFGTIGRVPGLPWATQVVKKSQNLVRGSPKGSLKESEKGQKRDQNEIQSGKNEGRGPKRTINRFADRHLTIFNDFWSVCQVKNL